MKSNGKLYKKSGQIKAHTISIRIIFQIMLSYFATLLFFKYFSSINLSATAIMNDLSFLLLSGKNEIKLIDCRFLKLLFVTPTTGFANISKHCDTNLIFLSKTYYRPDRCTIWGYSH